MHRNEVRSPRIVSVHEAYQDLSRSVWYAEREKAWSGEPRIGVVKLNWREEVGQLGREGEVQDQWQNYGQNYGLTFMASFVLLALS